jgi:hypothetical protein
MYTEDEDDFEDLDRGDELPEDEDLDDEEELDEDLDEDEDSDNEDEEDFEEDEVEEKPKRNSQKIPKSRLDEVIRQREEEKARSAWLASQLEKLLETKKQEEVKIEPSYDFDEAEAEYAKLLIEGELEKAAKIRSKINQERNKELKALIESVQKSTIEQTQTLTSKTVEESKFNAEIALFEDRYPFLDSSSDEYNEEAVDTVNTLLAGYVSAGKTKVEALRMAVKKVTPLYKIDKPSKPTLGEQRKKEAGIKAARASKSQPLKTKSTSPSTRDMGEVDIKKITDKDFSKLTAKEKAILRGDIL